MRLRLLVAIACLVALPGAAVADMVTPGFSRVPHDYVFEIEGDVTGYRFWLVSDRGVELLDLAPGRSVLVNGEGRHGSHRIAQVVAAPVALVEQVGEAKLIDAHWKHELPPGVIRSDSFDFYGSVPFWDSRSRVIDRYRVEFVPGQSLRMVWLERNTGSWWLKGAWIAAGVFTVVAVVWAGRWVTRRIGRALAGKQPTA